MYWEAVPPKNFNQQITSGTAMLLSLEWQNGIYFWFLETSSELYFWFLRTSSELYFWFLRTSSELYSLFLRTSSEWIEDDYHHVDHTFHQHVRKYKLMEELKKWIFPWSGRRWVVKAQFHKIRWIINVFWIFKSTMIRNYNKLISITITIIVKTPTQPNLT